MTLHTALSLLAESTPAFGNLSWSEDGQLCVLTHNAIYILARYQSYHLQSDYINFLRFLDSRLGHLFRYGICHIGNADDILV